MPLGVFVPARAEDLSLSFASGVDSAAQGAVLYRNGSSRYAALAAGPSGQALLSQGAGANPIWGAPAADLSPAVILAPAASARNVIQPTGNGIVPFVVKQFGSSTSNLQEWQASGGGIVARINNNGAVVGGDFLASGDYLNTISTAAFYNEATAAGVGYYNLFSSNMVSRQCLVVKGIAAQTAPLQEWRNSANSTLATMDPAGTLNVQAFGCVGDIGPTGGTGILLGAASAAGTGYYSFFQSADTGRNAMVIRNVAGQTASPFKMQTSGGGLLADITPGGVARLQGLQTLDNITLVRVFEVTALGNVEFRRTDSTTAESMVAGVVAEFNSNTHASYTGRLKLTASDASGTREGLRIEGDGTNPRVGFLGAVAVVRQTLAATATDLATVITLANSLRSGLINLGLGV